MNKGDIVKLDSNKYGDSLSKSWGLGVIMSWQDVEKDWRIVKIQWMNEEIPPKNQIDTHLALDLTWVTPYAPTADR